MENLDRPAKLKEFAETCANGAAFVLNPLSTDASSRKYYRMRFNNGGSSVIMTKAAAAAPANLSNFPPFSAPAASMSPK
mgnify:CR=1 FL=1